MKWSNLQDSREKSSGWTSIAYWVDHSSKIRQVVQEIVFSTKKILAPFVRITQNMSSDFFWTLLRQNPARQMQTVAMTSKENGIQINLCRLVSTMEIMFYALYVFDTLLFHPKNFRKCSRNSFNTKSDFNEISILEHAKKLAISEPSIKMSWVMDCTKGFISSRAIFSPFVKYNFLEIGSMINLSIITVDKAEENAP